MYIQSCQEVHIYYTTKIMSYIDTFKKFKLDEEIESREKEIEEMSTSAGAGAYDTPNAFSPADDDTIEMLGYKKVKKVKQETKKPIKESEFVRLSKQMFFKKL